MLRGRPASGRPMRYMDRYRSELTDLIAPLSQNFQPDDFAPARVNFRWLIGATLTALAGIGLIGSVVTYSLDRTRKMIEMPEIAYSANEEIPAMRVRPPLKATDRLSFLTSPPHGKVFVPPRRLRWVTMKSSRCARL